MLITLRLSRRVGNRCLFEPMGLLLPFALSIFENVAVGAEGDDGLGGVGLLDLHEGIQMFLEPLPVFRVKAGVENLHVVS